MILAVDGGNSKTDVALVDVDGALLGHVRGPQSSPHHLGLDGCVAVLQALVDEVGLGDRRAAIGQVLLAGIDFPDEEEALRRSLEPRGWAERIRVGNDTFAVLRAGTERGWGIAITCGAGMNCVGVAPDGRHVRFPALGDITGDWGGGYDVGLAALGAAARSEDGRGPKTALEQLVPRYFDRATPLALARSIHRGEISRRRVVELAPLVMAEAETDAVAWSIVDRLVGEIVTIARTAADRLDFSETEVLVGGGLMRAAGDDVLERIAYGLGAGLTLRRTSAPPIVGAALLGLDELGAGSAALDRLRYELGAAVERLETTEVG
jgi:N-acetylglucosamine kinase-like BadF-type ATPase